ncbi:MAG: tetratricopeptide repeat protein [Bryobacterales bacterium]|nr:tetratricopeptide repeat protein [Bryobacterales bacterium]
MLEPGTVLAQRFRILRPLAGDEESYVAEDQALRTTVALRRLPPLDEPLRREIQLARSLTHPNVIRVFELVGDGDGYLSMEFIEGETLAQRLARQGPLSAVAARNAAMQIVSAMDAVRGAGIVHGALRPESILLTTRSDGTPRAVVTGFLWTGAAADDQRDLESILATLGVRRDQLQPASVRPSRPRRKRWLLAAACAAVFAAAVYYRDEILAPPLSESAARWYREGETAIADGAYAKAEALFTQALREAPHDAAARCRLAEALQESDQRDRASAELLKALDARTRSRSDRLLREATQHYLTGDWEKALAASRARARVSGDSISAADVARLLDRAGRLEAARAEYEAVLRRYPSQPGPILQYARLLIANKQEKPAAQRLDEAERFYRALQNREGLAAIELERGRLTPNVSNAIAHARNAASLAEAAGSNALLVRARLLEAVRHAAGGDMPQSERMARDAVALAEKNSLGAVAAEGLIDLAEVVFTQLHLEEAARILQQARAIAQRFSAKRTDAEVSLRMGRVLARMGDEQRRREAHAHLDDAEKAFRGFGSKAGVVRALRARGDLYRLQSKLPLALEQQQRVARESDNEFDRTQARVAQAEIYMLQGNYLNSANLHAETAAYYRANRNPLLAQRYTLDQAQALRLVGRYDEAESLVRQIIDEGPLPGMRHRVEADMAAIDFGRRRFDRVFSRLEQITARLDPVKDKAYYDRRRYDLCMKYASAGWTAQAEKLCTEIAPHVRASERRYLDVLDALAMVSLQKRSYHRAARLARESLALSEANRMTESMFFTLMLLTRALHGAKDPHWVPTRERTRQALSHWQKEAGAEVVRQSLARWFIAEHWNSVQQLE